MNKNRNNYAIFNPTIAKYIFARSDIVRKCFSSKSFKCCFPKVFLWIAALRGQDFLILHLQISDWSSFPHLAAWQEFYYDTTNLKLDSVSCLYCPLCAGNTFDLRLVDFRFCLLLFHRTMSQLTFFKCSRGYATYTYRNRASDRALSNSFVKSWKFKIIVQSSKERDFRKSYR